MTYHIVISAVEVIFSDVVNNEVLRLEKKHLLLDENH